MSVNQIPIKLSWIWWMTFILTFEYFQFIKHFTTSIIDTKNTKQKYSNSNTISYYNCLNKNNSLKLILLEDINSQTIEFRILVSYQFNKQTSLKLIKIIIPENIKATSTSKSTKIIENKRIYQIINNKVKTYPNVSKLCVVKIFVVLYR